VAPTALIKAQMSLVDLQERHLRLDRRARGQVAGSVAGADALIKAQTSLAEIH